MLAFTSTGSVTAPHLPLGKRWNLQLAKLFLWLCYLLMHKSDVMALIKAAAAADRVQYWPLSAAIMVSTPIILLLLGV